MTSANLTWLQVLHFRFESALFFSSAATGLHWVSQHTADEARKVLTTPTSNIIALTHDAVFVKSP